MTESYCNVALPVPLRTAFTYAVPESLRGQLQPGSRVLVPFRKKAMVGVVLELPTTPPEGTRVREIHKVLDLLPALTPKLLELGQWMAAYYLAPIGESLRAMLPPVTELRTKRKIVLTEAGTGLAEKWKARTLGSDFDGAEGDFLQRLLEKNGERTLGPAVVGDLEFRVLPRRREPQRATRPLDEAAGVDEADGIADPVLRGLYKASRKRALA